MSFRSLFNRRHSVCWALTIIATATLAGAQTSPVTARRSPLPQDASAVVTTPLITSAAQGDADTVRSLVAAGANVNQTDAHGRTALIVAVESNQPAAARALVTAGADLNREANYIGSALNVAENSGQTEVAAWLLAVGAHSTGKSVGDMVCVRPWGGNGYCGVVKSFSVRSLQISVTKLIGCGDGCPARQECSAGNPVGGVNGLHVGEQIATPSWCLTDTAVKE
jgi:hypothetical protein